MAATNVQAYRVFGPAIVYVATGTNGAMEALGVTESGANIAIMQHRRPVYTDIGGPEVPAETQGMGETATIRFKLIPYKEETLRRLSLMAYRGIEKVAFSPGTNTTSANYGAIAPRGRLIGTDNGFFGLFFPPASSATNTQYEEGWHFPTCDMEDAPIEISIGTVITGVQMSLKAIPFIAGDALKIPGINSDATMSKLFTRTNTSQSQALVP